MTLYTTTPISQKIVSNVVKISTMKFIHVILVVVRHAGPAKKFSTKAKTDTSVSTIVVLLMEIKTAKRSLDWLMTTTPATCTATVDTFIAKSMIIKFSGEMLYQRAEPIHTYIYHTTQSNI